MVCFLAAPLLADAKSPALMKMADKADKADKAVTGTATNDDKSSAFSCVRGIHAHQLPSCERSFYKISPNVFI